MASRWAAWCRCYVGENACSGTGELYDSSWAVVVGPPPHRTRGPCSWGAAVDLDFKAGQAKKQLYEALP